MLGKIYQKTCDKILNISLRKPFLVFFLTLLITIPAIFLVAKLKIDTNLITLLPESNRSSLNTRQLQDKIGDGGHFIVFFESENRENLISAANYASKEIEKFDEVDEVQLHFPKEFIEKYGFTLVPNDYLEKLYDQLLDLEAEINPFVEKIDDTEESEKIQTHGDREDEQDMEVMLRQYMSKPDYYENEDGTIIGFMIPTKDGVSSIGKIKDLYEEIQKICKTAEDKYSVWSGIGGNHRNKINELETITSDLNNSGLIAVILIIILLFIGFKSLRPIFAVIFPLVIGLIWGFAFVPVLVGPLNLITSFLILIMFGMGIDFSIHIVKRYIQEIFKKDIDEALKETYKSTGTSVLISGMTTALSLAILAFSGFRGFSEFGIIAALSITFILLAMYIVLPAILVIFTKWNLFRNKSKESKFALIPSWPIASVMAIITLALSIVAARSLEFDYMLSNLDFDKAKIGDYLEVREKHEQVFSKSMSPAAIFLVHGKENLDRFNEIVKEEKEKDSSMIGRIRSIRDFAPADDDAELRLELIEEIKDILEAEWTNDINNKEFQDLIKEIKIWEIPESCPTIDEIPGVLKNSLVSRDNDKYYLLTLYPKEERKDGRNAIRFTENLYNIKLPENVRGPIGETVIFADLLTLVLDESWWMGLLTLGAIFILVLITCRSLKETLLILFPLLSGIAATMGIMALLDMKLSFFNIIVIPALLGMGVDGGVHYVRRWLESGKDITATHKELFAPLSLATFTTMLGYSGMVFAHHSGIRSIGIFACMGLFLIWITTLIILPGLLKFFSKK